MPIRCVTAYTRWSIACRSRVSQSYARRRRLFGTFFGHCMPSTCVVESSNRSWYGRIIYSISCILNRWHVIKGTSRLNLFINCCGSAYKGCFRPWPPAKFILRLANLTGCTCKSIWWLFANKVGVSLCVANEVSVVLLHAKSRNGSEM